MASLSLVIVKPGWSCWRTARAARASASRPRSIRALTCTAKVGGNRGFTAADRLLSSRALRWSPPSQRRILMHIGEIGPDLRHGGIEGACLLQIGEPLGEGLLGLRPVPDFGPGLAGVIDGLEGVRPAAYGALVLRLLELEVEG